MKGIFKLCREYVKAHRKLLTLYVFLCVFLGLQSLASPYITGNFIDSLISSSSGANIIKYCAVFVAITLSGVIIGYVTNRLYIKLQTTISYELNKSALAHLQRVSYSFVKNQDTAALNQRINNDSNALITFYISLCQNIVINVITVFIGFAIIASFNMILAEVLFVLIPCYSLAYSIFKQKLSKQIIDGTAEHITLSEGGVGLDIGCGSGALTIACAKRNPQGKMIGIDRWGKEYASFSLPLCEKNAAAEGVKNASFQRGNAVKLDFPDESCGDQQLCLSQYRGKGQAGTSAGNTAGSEKGRNVCHPRPDVAR